MFSDIWSQLVKTGKQEDPAAYVKNEFSNAFPKEWLRGKRRQLCSLKNVTFKIPKLLALFKHPMATWPFSALTLALIH